MRAAIVGAGLMGKWHAHAVTRAGHRVTTVVDPDMRRADALARTLGARAAHALDAANPDVDVVHLCTPLESHARLAHLALDRGWHVIVEKPMTERAGETEALLSHAAAANRLIAPVHQFLFQHGVLHATAVMASLGRLLHADVVVCTAGASGGDSAGKDRVVMEVLPHPLSLFARFISHELDAVQWSVQHARAGELRIAGTIAGVSASALVSAGGRPPVNQLRLICESGTISADLFHGFAVIARGKGTRTGKLARPFLSASATFGAAGINLVRRLVSRERAYPGLGEFVRRFYTAAGSGGVSPISAAEVLAVAGAMDDVAARLGR